MLVLTRKVGEEIRIGDEIVVTLVRVQGEKVRLGIEAPRDVVIRRGELAARLRRAAEGDPGTAHGLDEPSNWRELDALG
jgi:carbon storage regulator